MNDKKIRPFTIRLLRNVLIAATLFTFIATPAAFAKQLRMIGSWPETFILSKGAVLFMKNVNELSKGDMTVTFTGPDAVPAYEQLQPLQAGVFDLLFTHPNYHSGATGIGLAVDAVKIDPTKRRETGIFDFVDQHYKKLKVKLIAITPLSSYHFVTREPIDNNKPSFKGLKIRGPSSAHTMIRELGGSPVNMPGGEVYTALQKGVLDGSAWTSVGVKDNKWYEVAPFLVRPTFSYISTFIFMNRDRYNKLTPAQRKVIDEAGRKTEIDAFNYYKDLAAAEEKELKRLGMKETYLQPEDAKRAGEIMSNSIWDIAIKKSGEEAKKFRDFVNSKGMEAK